MIKLKISVFLCFIGGVVFAQNNYSSIGKTFYDTRVVNGQSVEMSNEGVMKFIIGHRFGRLNSGAYNLYGLDNSTIRLGFDYALKKWINIGIGRSSFEKTYDGFVKVRLIEQGTKDSKNPISLVVHSSLAYKTLKPQTDNKYNTFENRLFYTHQLLIAKKISDRFSVQCMPTLVHRNLVETDAEKNDVLALGGAMRYVVTKRFTISAEYYHTATDALASRYKNSISLGLNLETKGHVFQFHFGNSRGMIEKFFITETTGDWAKGDIHFGFNITRDFKLKGKKN